MAIQGGNSDDPTPSDSGEFGLDALRSAFPSAQVVEGSGWRGAYWEKRGREFARNQSSQGEREGRAERAPASALNLEEGTLSDLLPPGGSHDDTREGWAVRVFEYPQEVYEVRAVRVHRATALSRAVDDLESLTGPPVVEPLAENERFESSVRRARQGLQRRCLALAADHMLTLTKRGKFQCIDDVWAAFERFSRMCRRFYGDKWKFVAVPELHKDGTYHMHVALRGFFWAGILRRFWSRALGGTGNETGDSTLGNVHLKSFVRVRGCSQRVARYVAKYVGKGFSALDRGRRSYSCSTGLVPLRITRWREPLHFGHTGCAAALQRRLRDALNVSHWDTWFWSRAGMTGFILTSRS